MKKESILKSINDFIENGNMEVLLKLKDDLMEDIRKEVAYTSNSKSRVNAIAKMQKENVKRERERYNGYALIDGKYYFTNAYYIVALNDGLGYSDNKQNYGNAIPSDLSQFEKINLNLDEVMVCYKTKQDIKLNDIYFDYNYLKQVIDILGDCKVMQREYMLYFENDKGEKGALVSKKTF